MKDRDSLQKCFWHYFDDSPNNLFCKKSDSVNHLRFKNEYVYSIEIGVI